MLVPRRFREAWPFICMYHRSDNHIKTSMEKGVPRVQSSGGFGHYESLLADCAADDSTSGPTLLEGVFPSSHPMHAHLSRIAIRLLATEFNDLARLRMADDYNSQQSVVEYQKLNSVGVRVGHGSKAGKRRQARGTDNLPSIVVAVHTQVVGDAATQALHKQYTLLTEFGLLENTWKVDELVPLSLHNFPQLASIMADLSAAELLSETSPDARPIDLSRYPRIGIEDAWKQHRAKRMPATKSAARVRATPSRTVAVAAETAIVNSRLDRRRAPSLFTVSSQPASVPLAHRAPAHIVKLLAKNSKYKVLWSDPPNTWTWETFARIESYEENRGVLEKYRRRQEEGDMTID